MGRFSFFASHNKCSACATRATEDSKNPDPDNFKILDYFVDGDFLLIKINYPNATNFEGNKIMLYKGVKLLDLINSRSIDPHFYENQNSPIARFVPTDAGWEMAIKVINSLKGQ